MCTFLKPPPPPKPKASRIPVGATAGSAQKIEEGMKAESILDAIMNNVYSGTNPVKLAQWRTAEGRRTKRCRGLSPFELDMVRTTLDCRNSDPALRHRGRHPAAECIRSLRKLSHELHEWHELGDLPICVIRAIRGETLSDSPILRAGLVQEYPRCAACARRR